MRWFIGLGMCLSVIVGMALFFQEAPLAEACPVPTVRYVAPVKQVVVVQEVPFVQLVPVTIAVPQYSIGQAWSSPPAAAYDPLFEEFRAWKAARQGLGQVLPPANPQSPNQPAPPPAPSKNSGSRWQRGDALLLSDCAKCHDKAAATARAKGHVFFDAGKIFEPDKNSGPMLEKIESGDMPKDRRWTDAQKLDAVWRLTVTEEEPKK